MCGNTSFQLGKAAARLAPVDQCTKAIDASIWTRQFEYMKALTLSLMAAAGLAFVFSVAQAGDEHHGGGHGMAVHHYNPHASFSGHGYGGHGYGGHGYAVYSHDYFPAYSPAYSSHHGRYHSAGIGTFIGGGHRNH